MYQLLKHAHASLLIYPHICTHINKKIGVLQYLYLGDKRRVSNSKQLFHIHLCTAFKFIFIGTLHLLYIKTQKNFIFISLLPWIPSSLCCLQFLCVAFNFCAKQKQNTAFIFVLQSIFKVCIWISLAHYRHPDPSITRLLLMGSWSVDNTLISCSVHLLFPFVFNFFSLDLF